MRTTPLVGLALLFGCNPNYYGVDPDDDTNDDVEDTGTDTNVDTGDTEDTEPVSDCHLADPLALTGWTRTYSVTWEGKTGTEVHTPMGEGYTSSGTEAYIIQMALTTTEGDQLTTNDYRVCNSAGGADWLESQVNGQAKLDLLGDFGGDMGDFAEIIALITQLFGSQGGTNPLETTMPVTYRKLPTPGVPYLADAAGLSSGSLISYDYDLMTAGQTTDMFAMPNCASGANGTDLDATCVGISGNLQPLGLTSVTVPAGTFQAYRIVDNRTERWSESSASGTAGLPDLSQLFPMLGGFLGNNEDLELISELYYVPGIGLVQERTKYADAAPDDWLIVRSLTSYTGLTAAE